MGNYAKPEIFSSILMQINKTEILSIKSLEIGYVSGRSINSLLPPVNAKAEKGDLIAVIGRNGIGKSTLLRTLAGIQSSLGGDIWYDGKNIRDYSRIDLAQKVGYISTETVKVTNMSVYDLVSLGRFPHTNWFGRIEAEDHAKIMDAIKKTSIPGFCNKFIAELSDGERQKAMIARILAQDSGIMIMDEPTAFLDVASKYEILQLMHLLTREDKKTIIFSTHDLNLAVSQADKIWVILDNQLKEGSPEDLMIDGTFDHLFESSVIRFNSENGSFSFTGEDKGSLFIEGEGIIKHWTEEAVKRAGFSVTRIKKEPYIMFTSGNNKKWKLISQTSEHEFPSIYLMVKFLEDNYLSLF
jgi:iron complex transport system ATP-binding protein